jgi:hypothetical protein
MILVVEVVMAAIASPFVPYQSLLCTFCPGAAQTYFTAVCRTSCVCLTCTLSMWPLPKTSKFFEDIFDNVVIENTVCQ